MRFPVQLVLVLLSAAVQALCFPPFGMWPFVLLVFPLLFLATTNTTLSRAWYLGLLQGTLGYAFTLYWFFHIFGAAAVVLWALLALFTAICCLLFNFIAKQTRSALLNVFLVATIWTAIEFFRSELFFLRFPWITPGSALGPTYLSPILGVYGASFLVILASAGFMRRRTVPYAIILSLCVMCLGLFRPGPIEPDEKNSVVVTIVQGEDCSIQSYIEMTRTAYKESPDLIIWPEYSLPYDVRKNVRDFGMLTNLCAEMDAVLVVGTQTISGTEGNTWHNTALVLNERGVLGEYYKARPVHLFNDGIPGREFKPVQTELGAFATPICFDSDYSEVSRMMAMLGAEYFAVPSCDPKSWSANQHLQHALLFRLRAAENARWLACASSSGVSQVIDPHGNVRRSLPLMENGVLTCRIGRSRRVTFFTRAGWIFPWLTLGGSVILLAYAGVRMMTPGARKARLEARKLQRHRCAFYRRNKSGA